MKCFGQLWQGMADVGELTKTYEEIRKATQSITGRKYCSSCHAFQLVEGGKEVPIATGKRTRWKCANCLKNASARKYQAKEKK